MSESKTPRTEDAPALGPVELLRWTWRQLTSMRTALVLLLLLALGAVPGSIVPQSAVDSIKTANWQSAHPKLTPIYEKLGLFSVYDSAWFSAIYLLLMVSLVGCIVPRLRVYWRALRARPPKAPKNLARLPQHRSWETDETPEEVLQRARKVLKRRRFRVDTNGDAVSAERGYLREAGNLLFHLSLLIVLVGFASGSLLGYKGGVIVVTGEGFANTPTQYDDFEAGSLFDTARLAPFQFTVDDFKVDFIREGRETGMARKFEADLSYQAKPGDKVRRQQIAVNHPLDIDGTDVFLLGHGYAPHVTVRNPDGTKAFSGPVVFLPEDSSFRSMGVIKVPDTTGTQLGFQGELYPTYRFTMETGPYSAFPDATDPVMSMVLWSGDLGLDSGRPQSVYALDTKGMKKVRKADGQQVRVDLAFGKTVQLPDGLGSISFDGMSRYVKLQISNGPGQEVALGGMILALVGLLGSLFIRPRRVWVRTRSEGGRTLVEVAGLDRSAGGDLAIEVDDFAAALAPPSTGPDHTEEKS